MKPSILRCGVQQQASKITAVLTDALATKLHGDPRSEYRLEWTEKERLDSAFLVVSALHLEALRRSGIIEINAVPADPWAPGAVFEYRLTGRRRGQGRRLNAWALMKVFLPKAWRCPADFVISEAADRRMERRMSRRTQTTWPGPAHRCFRAAQQPAMFVKVGTRPGGTMSGILYAKCYR